MSYSQLQDSVDELRAHNQQVTDKLIHGGGDAMTAEKTVADHRTAAKASRQSTELLITNTTAERDLALDAETNAQSEQAGAEAARDIALDQPALAQTEAARAVSAANAAEITALGAHSGLASVASVHIRPSLVLDFAKGEYWKQGAYPWLKEIITNPLPGVSLVEDAATGEVLGAGLQAAEILAGLVSVDSGTLVVYSDTAAGLVASAAGNTLEATSGGRARRAIAYTSGNSPDLVLEPGIITSVTVFSHALSAAELEELTL